MPRSFDIIGSKEKSVAIVEIRKSMKEKEIAKEIMAKNKNVKSVLKKESPREGKFRTRKYKLIAGDKNTEVIHKEHGYSLKLDPQKTYFSVREGTERQRVASQVKPRELVMVMFAGIGPYAVAIAKKQPKVKKIIAVEINPESVKYMKYNIRVNKFSHKISPVLGNVRDVCKKWYKKCDRIVMPLPLDAEDFLDIAIKCAKKKTTVHFYAWGNKADGDIYEDAKKAIARQMKKLGVAYKVVNKRIVLPYAPGKFKVCIEFKVL